MFAYFGLCFSLPTAQIINFWMSCWNFCNRSSLFLHQVSVLKGLSPCSHHLPQPLPRFFRCLGNTLRVLLLPALIQPLGCRRVKDDLRSLGSARGLGWTKVQVSGSHIPGQSFSCVCIHPLVLCRDPLPALPFAWISTQKSCSFFHLSICSQGRALHFSVRKEQSSLGLMLWIDECPFLSLPGQCWWQQQQRRDAPVKDTEQRWILMYQVFDGVEAKFFHYYRWKNPMTDDSVGDGGGLESGEPGRGSCSSGQWWGCDTCSVPRTCPAVAWWLCLGKGSQEQGDALSFCFIFAPQHSELMRPVSQHLQLIFFILRSDHTLLLTLKEHLTPII